MSNSDTEDRKLFLQTDTTVIAGLLILFSFSGVASFFTTQSAQPNSTTQSTEPVEFVDIIFSINAIQLYVAVSILPFAFSAVFLVSNLGTKYQIAKRIVKWSTGIGYVTLFVGAAALVGYVLSHWR